MVSQSKLNLKIICFILTLVASNSFANAKTFKNSYIQFNLPEQWDCQLNEKAYICRHKISSSCLKGNTSDDCKKQIKKSKEAIIVMAAKEKSNIDSIDSYLSILKEPRKIVKNNGPTTQSKVIHNKAVNINKQKWVDGMHISSELPFYYTRYLASVKGNVAVLVTFSAHKLFYTQYSNEFFKSIKSLEIIADNSMNIKPSEMGNKVLSRPLDLPDDLLAESASEGNNQSESSTSQLLFLLAFLLASFGVYVWIKNNKNP